MDGEGQQSMERVGNIEGFKANQTHSEHLDWLPTQTRQATKAMALLLFFSFLMFSVPFLVFFGTKHVLLEDFHLEVFQCNAIAVFAAVVTVNIIIGIYVYIAYKEPEYDSQGNVIKEETQYSKDKLELKRD